MSNHDFCRTSYNFQMETVRKYVPADIRRGAWAYRYSSSDHVELHVPGRQGTYGSSDGKVVDSFQADESHWSRDYFYNGNGCCTWWAKSEGWDHFLQVRCPQLYSILNRIAEGDQTAELPEIELNKATRTRSRMYYVVDGKGGNAEGKGNLVGEVYKATDGTWRLSPCSAPGDGLDTSWLIKQRYNSRRAAVAAMLAELTR